MDPSNVDAWDDVFVNPHQASISEGREQGTADGRIAGHAQGVRIGSITAVNYGMEVGFIRGVVDQLLHLLQLRTSDSDRDDSEPYIQISMEKREKIQKSLLLLSQCLNEFPNPNEVFDIGRRLTDEHDETNQLNDITNNKSNDESEDHYPRRSVHDRIDVDADDGEHDDEPVPGETSSHEPQQPQRQQQQQQAQLDVAGRLQRIRARFKLIMVQLSLPHFSLTSVMDAVAVNNGSATAGNTAASEAPRVLPKSSILRPNSTSSEW